MKLFAVGLPVYDDKDDNDDDVYQPLLSPLLPRFQTDLDFGCFNHPSINQSMVAESYERPICFGLVFCTNSENTLSELRSPLKNFRLWHFLFPLLYNGAH